MSADDCPVDVETLDMLRDLADEDNPDFFQDILQSYVDDATTLMANLQKGAADADIDLMARSAHTLKSSSANVGANGLAALCATLERRTRSESSIPDAPDVVREIEMALKVVLEFMANQV